MRRRGPDSARLRADKNTPLDKLKSKVNTMIRLLGLTKVQDFVLDRLDGIFVWITSSLKDQV